MRREFYRGLGDQGVPLHDHIRQQGRGVYETLLDDMELEELRANEGIIERVPNIVKEWVRIANQRT